MRGHVDARRCQALPARLTFLEELIADVRHPQIAMFAIVVEKPHTARFAFGLIDQPFRELAKETIRIGLANEKVERELHRMTLNRRAAFGALAKLSFALEG